MQVFLCGHILLNPIVSMELVGRGGGIWSIGRMWWGCVSVTVQTNAVLKVLSHQNNTLQNMTSSPVTLFWHQLMCKSNRSPQGVPTLKIGLNPWPLVNAAGQICKCNRNVYRWQIMKNCHKIIVKAPLELFLYQTFSGISFWYNFKHYEKKIVKLL